MHSDLPKGIVRILTRSEETSGTGFFISTRGLIVTCAHVLTDYQSEEVVLVELSSNNEKHQAQIIHKWWRDTTKEDIAILQLLSIPHNIAALSPGYPWQIQDGPLITFGFPASAPKEGLNAKCEVIGRTIVDGCPALQLRSPEVTCGFSGAPVLNPVTNKIIGMITAISKPDRYGRQSETVFVTPSDVLATVCFEIEETNLERIIEELRSEPSLGKLFVNLSVQSRATEDSYREKNFEASIIDKLGLDPSFRNHIKSSSIQRENPDNKASEKPENTIDLSTDIINEINKHSRSILLGEPGSGKTTILNKIVLDVAENCLSQSHDLLPLYLKLSTWEIEQSFQDFIYSQWPFASDPIFILQNGHFALFLDGLNEIKGRVEERIKQLLEWIEDNNNIAKIVISCRTSDYYLAGFDINMPGNMEVIEVKEMGEAEVRLFSEKYLEEIDEDVEGFLSQIFPNTEDKGNSILMNLSKNPFTLTALIFFYARRKSSDRLLSQNKGLLCKELVKSLWDKEEKYGWSGWLPYEQVEPMLSELAFHMIDHHNAVELSLTEASKYCSLEVLSIAKNANIVSIENDRLKFYHQLIQELFAAIQLKSIELCSIIKPPQIKDGERTNIRWDEVVVALCGIAENPDGIINDILELDDPYLAAICISSGVQVRDSTVKKTIDNLIRHIAIWNWQDSEKRSEVACKAISNIGKPAVPFLIDFIQNKQKVVVLDYEDTVKRAMKLLGEASLMIGGLAAGVSALALITAVGLALAPQVSFFGFLGGLLPAAKGLSENKNFRALVQFLKERPDLAIRIKEMFDEMKLEQKIEQIPREIDSIHMEPIRKVRLLKFIVLILATIEDPQARSAIDKLSKSDPNEEVRKTARSVIEEIERKRLATA